MIVINYDIMMWRHTYARFSIILETSLIYGFFIIINILFWAKTAEKIIIRT